MLDSGFPDLTGLMVLWAIIKSYCLLESSSIENSDCGLKPQEGDFHKSHANPLQVVLVSFFQLRGWMDMEMIRLQQHSPVQSSYIYKYQTASDSKIIFQPAI